MIPAKNKKYANEHPKGKKPTEDNNIKLASASQIKKNERLSNIILNELASDLILEDLKKKKKKNSD
tara:strand:- start:287 stop:484 length:198 start_codon:yes stop_codon:yes gene_type:complete